MRASEGIRGGATINGFRPAVLFIGGLLLLLPAAAPGQELDDDDKRFLNDVRPLILPDERALFGKLEGKADRLVFQEIFWARRDPDLATPENEFRHQYVKDRATADRRYRVPGTPGSATDCGRLFILAGKPDRIYRDEPLNRVVVGGHGATPSLIVRRPEVWVYRDRPERRIGFDRLETFFDEECCGRGDIAHHLDRIAATKIIHPSLDYEVGRDGHLLKPADQSAGMPRKTSIDTPPAVASPTSRVAAQDPHAASSAEIEQVVVDVVVTDDEGQPITDLAEADVEVYEDGVRQWITSFEMFEVPGPPLGEAAASPEEAVVRTRVSSNADEEDVPGRTFVIVFDDAHLTRDTARQAREVVALFLNAQTREGDRITLVAPAAGLWWSTRMAAGREEILEMLDTLQGLFEPDRQPDRLSDFEAMRGDVYRDRTTIEQVQGRDPRRGAGQRDQMARALDPGRTPHVLAKPDGLSPTLAARDELTLEAMERALNSLVRGQGRKSLILVSDGFTDDTQREEWKRTATASLWANTAIHFLNTRGMGAPREPDEGQEMGVLQSSVFHQELGAAGGAVALAQDTGGFILRDANELALGLQRIADEARAYYLIGYSPTNTGRDGGFRQIDIKVPGRKDIIIRARRGYHAPSGEAIAKAEEAAEDAALQEAMDSPYPVGDISLRMTHFVGEEATDGTAGVSVAVEVDIEDLGFEEQAEKDVAALRFVMVAMSRAGDRNVTYDQKVDVELPPDMRAELTRNWLPIVRELELEAGSYRTKIVVEDRATGRLGSVVHDFEVPEIEPLRLRVSTPVLSDVRVPERDGQPGERLALIARRVFTPEADLHCQFEVYGAARLESSGMPRVSTSYEVRRSDGALYTRGARSLIEPTAHGAVSRVIGFPLRAATADDYGIVVRIKDELSGKTHELREMFSVTPPTATAAALPPVTADTRTVAGYLELVERSCGETNAAILALSRWSSQELERVAQELFDCDRGRQASKADAPSTSPASPGLEGHCQSPPWAGAAALHTDLAFTLEPGEGDLFHLAFAARLLGKSPADGFRRRWYRAVGLNCLFRDQLGAARSYLEDGLDLFQGNPALLVALGASYEAEAWRLRLVLRALEAKPNPVLQTLARARGEQRRYWSEAADLYEQVLARDPEYSEARLRLGCVELLRDHTDRGLAMLRWVTVHAREPDLVYLAHLFIGRELKRSGDLDGALASYRAALETDPRGQAAYIATSHALRMKGRPTAAADVLERGLATRRPELTRDSWWRYPQARLGHTLELLTQMSEEICR